MTNSCRSLSGVSSSVGSLRNADHRNVHPFVLVPERNSRSMRRFSCVTGMRSGDWGLLCASKGPRNGVVIDSCFDIGGLLSRVRCFEHLHPPSFPGVGCKFHSEMATRYIGRALTASRFRARDGYVGNIVHVEFRPLTSYETSAISMRRVGVLN